MRSKSSSLTKADFASPTIDLRYRCVCGKELQLSDDAGECPSCGRSTPAAFDNGARTQTLVVRQGSVSTVSNRNSADEADAPKPGDRFGHFEILEPLGHGGMGAVYLALDTSLQRYVALKVIRGFGEGSTAGDRTAKLKQEAVAQARLNHRNVVTIYFVGEQDGRPFFAMELVPGQTLAAQAKIGPLPFARLVEVAIETAEALQHANAFDIVHGDIKPGNLMLDADGHIKLGDFGLARFQSEGRNADGSISGTLDYLAPELLDGAIPSLRSDLYALGVTLYELAYGKPEASQTGRTLVQRLEDQRQRVWTFPENDYSYPEAWHRILANLLARDPAERYQDYSELLKDLYRIRARALVPAGRVPRILAYLVDVFTAQVMMGVTSIPWLVVFLFGDRLQGWQPLMTFVTLCMVPIGWLAFIAIEVHLKKTPGRYLFQLRVVDRHGLWPNRKTMLIRHFLRMAQFISQALPFFLPALITVPLMVVAFMFFVADGLFALLMPGGRSLHDRICRTQVTLDHE